MKKLEYTKIVLIGSKITAFKLSFGSISLLIRFLGPGPESGLKKPEAGESGLKKSETGESFSSGSFVTLKHHLF